MPTRVFIPTSTASTKNTPGGSRRNSNSLTPRENSSISPRPPTTSTDSVESTPRRTAASIADGTYGIDRTKVKPASEDGTGRRDAQRGARGGVSAGTRKDGRTKWHYKAAAGLHETHEGTDAYIISPSKAKRAHHASEMQQKKLQDAQRKADARYDLEQPLFRESAHSVHPERADAYLIRHDESYAAQRAQEDKQRQQRIEAEADTLRQKETARAEAEAEQKHYQEQLSFKHSLRNTGQTLFNVEPRKEKKLFYRKTSTSNFDFTIIRFL